MRRSDRAVNDSKVIVNFGDSSCGGTRRARSSFLLDGNGGGEPLDGIDLGTFHLVKKLTGVGRKRFDITALALGVNGVKGERGFAGARKPGHHRETISRNIEADVLEIVL